MRYYNRSIFLSRMMILIIFLSLNSVLQAYAYQDSSFVSIDVKNVPIENVFRQIEKQTGIVFYYGASDLDGRDQVSLKLINVKVGTALDILLKGRNVSWRLLNGGVIIRKDISEQKSNDSSISDSIPNINVSGMVTDKAGTPILGVTVSIRGQSRGQGTDDMGHFRFSNIPANSTLVFSSIGYETKQIKLSGQSQLRIRLDTLIRDISGVEVVSTGYQFIPKERATGSFVQLGGDVLSRTPSTNILDRIQYVTNGLRYDPSEARGTKFIIRGFSTISSSKNPLIVIDGFPYEEQPVPSALERLNPNDVESITILKDAAAASIWGARSGNGVIVITTKKGKYNSRNAVTFSTNLSITEKPDIKKQKVMLPTDAVYFEQERFKAGYYNDYDNLYPSQNNFPVIQPALEILLAGKRNALTQAQVEQKLAEFSMHDVRDDLNRYFIRNAIAQRYYIAVSGGNSVTNYKLSIGYDNNKPHEAGSKTNRITLNFENAYKINKFIETNFYINYNNSTTKAPILSYANLIPGDNQVSPYTMLADSKGNSLSIPRDLRKEYVDTVKARGLLDWHYNPIDELNYGNSSTKVDNIRTGGKLKFNISRDLLLEINGQYNKSNIQSSNYESQNAYAVRDLINRFVYIDPSGRLVYPYPMGGKFNSVGSNQVSWNVRGQLNYNKTWRMHALYAIGGIEASETKYNSLSNTFLGYNKELGIYVPNIDYANTYTARPGGQQTRIMNSGGETGTLNRFRNYYGNVSYTLNTKYTISGSARIDETNLLGINANLRRVPLWSVGYSWNIANENFLRSKKIDFLNVRITYGWNGNINNTVSTLPIISFTSNNTSLYSNLPFASLLLPPNPNITWEKVAVTNIGLDYKFFNHRLSGSIEVYNKKGMNLIGSITTEPTRGIASYNGNYASILSQGLDFQISGVIINRKKLKLNSQFNFSYNRDKVLDVMMAASLLKNPQLYIGNLVLINGGPLFEMYSYKWAGLDPKTGDPRGYLADTIASYKEVLKGENTKPSDLIKHGNSSPLITGNLLTSFSIYDFTLSFNIYYKLKYYFRRTSVSYSNIINRWSDHSDFSNRWKKSGDELITNIPSMILAADSERDFFYASSSVLIEKADNIRLQDLRADYALPTKFINRLRMSNLSVNVTASNLGILWKATKYDIDPDNMRWPTPRSVTIGLNAKF